MLSSIFRKDKVLAGGTCIDIRGLTDDDILQHAERSMMPVPSQHILNAERPLFF
jgi:hypothetical protein